MSEPQPKQPAAASKVQALKIYVCEADTFEAMIARAWAKDRDPQALREGRVVDRVKLSKLAPHHVLVPILRPEGSSPTQTIERDPFGKRVRVRQAPIPELVKEITERGAIEVARHWLTSRVEPGFAADIFSSSFSGDVSTDSLFDALSQICEPCMPRVEVGEPDVMRLRRI